MEYIVSFAPKKRQHIKNEIRTSVKQFGGKDQRPVIYYAFKREKYDLSAKVRKGERE